MSLSLLADSQLGAAVQRVLQEPDVPAFSRQVREVMSGLEEDENSLQRLANLVLREYALSLKVLRTANTLFYNRSARRVKSITHAMLLMGARSVRRLAATLLLFEHYQQQSAELKELMLLSMLSAQHARELALRVGLAEPEEAYLCGMFHNLGEVLVACHFPQAYAAIREAVVVRGVAPRTAQMRVLGYAYEDLAGAIAQHWAMPQAVVQTLRATTATTEGPLGQVAHLAHELTHAVYRAPAGEAESALEAVGARLGKRFDLPREELKDVLQSGTQETRILFTDAGLRLDDLWLARQCYTAVQQLTHTRPSTGPLPACATPTLDEVREESLRELASALVAPSAELHPLTLMVLEAALTGGRATRAAFCLFDAGRTELRARIGLGRAMEELTSRLCLPAALPPLGSALLEGRELLLDTTATPALLGQRWLRDTRPERAAFLPILVDGRPLGALYLDGDAAALAFDPATLGFFRTLRDQLARLLDRGRRDHAA